MGKFHTIMNILAKLKSEDKKRESNTISCPRCGYVVPKKDQVKYLLCDKHKRKLEKLIPEKQRKYYKRYEKIVRRGDARHSNECIVNDCKEKGNISGAATEFTCSKCGYKGPAGVQYG